MTNLIYKVILVLVLGSIVCNTIFAEEYRVAVRAHSGIEKARDKWQATIDYLSEKIPGHTFVLIPVIDLSKITTGVASNEYDFVLTNPSSYIELKTLYSARALVTLNNKRDGTHQTRFGSVIFTLAERDDIYTLNDLQGKTLMGVTPQAFGGWRVAWFELLNNDIDPFSDLKSILYAKSKHQPEVVYAVRDGRADVGIVRTDMLERMSNEGLIDLRYYRILNNQTTEGFPFFHSTSLYPEWPFVSTKNVPVNVAGIVKTALVSITPENSAAVAGKYVGWVSALDYFPVQNLMKRLRVGPYAGDTPLDSHNTIQIIIKHPIILSVVAGVLLLLVAALYLRLNILKLIVLKFFDLKENRRSH